MKILAVLVLATLCVIPGLAFLGYASVGDATDQSNKLGFDVVAYCRKLSMSDYYEFIRDLGKRKQYASLRAIYESDLPDHSCAAGELSANLDSGQAIMLCTQLELGSSNWLCAFGGLAEHPREKVLGYIKQMAFSRLPEVRGCCYTICEFRAWDDLIEMAIADSRSSELFISTNQPAIGEGRTLGSVSREYIATIEKIKEDGK